MTLFLSRMYPIKTGNKNMIDILNVAVVLSCILLNLIHTKDELNNQGRQWKRWFRFRIHQIESDQAHKGSSKGRKIRHAIHANANEDVKDYRHTIEVFDAREKALTKGVYEGRYIAVSIVVIALTYVILYAISENLVSWASSIATPVAIALSSLTIRYIGGRLIPKEIEIDSGDITIVVSVMLIIPVMMHDWRLGLYVLGITLGKIAFFDFAHSLEQIRSGLKRIGTECHGAIYTCIHICILYTFLFLFYRFVLRYEINTWFVMICAYWCMFMAEMAYHGGMRNVTNSTKRAVDREIKGKKNP